MPNANPEKNKLTPLANNKLKFNCELAIDGTTLED
jgi:hypothetical protein